MHLNRECPFPDLDNLFQRTDVTAAVQPLLGKVGWEIDAQLANGSTARCPMCRSAGSATSHTSVRSCALLAQRSRSHHAALQHRAQKRCGFLVSGVHRISDLPADQKLNATQKRQIRAMKADRLVVEATLGQALEPLDASWGFSTSRQSCARCRCGRAWAPWEQAPAQFSYHESNSDGTSRTPSTGEGRRTAGRSWRAPWWSDKERQEGATYSSFEKTRIRDCRTRCRITR